MLLFLLSFYLHYDLLSCEENVTAKLNESLLVDHQKLLQVNSLLVDLELKTRKLSGLLAENHPYAIRRETNALRDLLIRSLISEKDQNHHITNPLIIPGQVPTKPAEIFRTHSPVAGLGARDTTISPKLIRSGPHIPSPFDQPVHWAYPLLSILPELHMGGGPSLYATSFLSSSTTRARPQIHHLTYTPYTLSSAKKTTSLGPKARDWFKGLAPYTRVKKKKWKTSGDQTPPTMTSPGMYTPPTYKSNMWKRLDENQQGPLNDALAKKFSKSGQTPEDPFKGWTTKMTTEALAEKVFISEQTPEDPFKGRTTKMTTAGDVLYGKIKVQNPSSTEPPNPHYQELMRELGEGYLVVFGIEMFRLISVKDKQEVQAVLRHVDKIYNKCLRSGDQVGNPFLIIFGNLVKMTSKDEIDTLRTYSSMMFHTLVKRKEVLSPEINFMIDQAGLSYNNEDGNRLLCSLSDFDDFPNTHKSSYSICEGLVDSILQPVQRPKCCHELMSSLNKVLRENFPQLLRNHDVGTPTTLSLIRTTISRIGTRSRKRKRRHHHHKKKRKRKRRLKREYNNKDTRPKSQDLVYQQPSFTEPITTIRYKTVKTEPTNAMTWTTYPPTPTINQPTHQSISLSITNLPTHVPTKKIVARILVHNVPRDTMTLKKRKQTGHARISSRSTRTPKYREMTTFEDMDSIAVTMLHILRRR